MNVYQQLKEYERYIGYTYSYDPAYADSLGTRTVTILRLRLNKIGTKVICESVISYSNGGSSHIMITPINQLIEAGRLKEIPYRIKYKNIKGVKND